MRLKTILVLSFAIMWTFFTGAAFAEEGMSSEKLFIEQNNEQIRISAINNIPYLFLPSYTNVETLDLPEGCIVMTASAIPTVFLHSSNSEEEGRLFVDASKSNRTHGSMRITDSEGDTIYNGELAQIRARGNSTFTHTDKKSYQIKLDKKSDLLENGEKVKTWVLLAGYNDATKIRDKTMKDLATSIGMPYVASSTWVNLYYDGEYRGLYLLSEKNSVNKTSVNIADMEDDYSDLNDEYGENAKVTSGKNRFGQSIKYTIGLSEPEDLTGGYLLEFNGSTIDEASGFYTKHGRAINVKSPEWAGKDAILYISELYQEFEDAVYARDSSGNYTGYNENTGKYYYDYVDKDSLIKTFLMKELSQNPDEFVYSTFFYKDRGTGLMYSGPIWDQEMVFGTAWSFWKSPDSTSKAYLEEALIHIPDFREAVRDYYQTSFAEETRNLLDEDGMLLSNTSMIWDSVAMDHILWPFIKVGIPSSPQHFWGEDTSYQDIVNDMTSWVTQRIVYLDKLYGEDSSGGESDPTPTTPGKPEKPISGGGGTAKPEPVDPEPSPEPTPEPEPEPAPAVFFEDVPEDAYYYDPVKWAVDNGVTNGIDDTRFGPDLSCTRAQMVTFLWRAAGSPEPAAENNPFTDVEAGSYYEKAVLWAVEKGITNGTSETTFSPDMTVTRGQSVTFLYRFTGEKTDADIPFEDVEEGAYYEEAVQWAVSAEVTKGTSETTFEPESPCTRAQIVTFLYRAMAE